MANIDNSNTIKKEVFRSSMIYSVVLLLGMACLMGLLLFKSEKIRVNQVIKLHNESTNHIIAGHFNEMSHIVTSLSETNYVRNASLDQKIDKKKLLNYYQNIQNSNSKITHLYSAYANNLLLINDGPLPEGFKPTNQAWFTYAVEKAPNISIGLPYQDAITNDWLISTGKAFTDANNQFGVVAIDSSLKTVTELLATKTILYNSSVSFITDLDGNIIAHPNVTKITTTLKCAHNHLEWKNKDKGNINYKEGNINKTAYYSKINGTGWLLFTEVAHSEIIQPIVIQVMIHIALLATIALTATFIYSSWLSLVISSPLIRLKKHVQHITRGLTPPENRITFPDNEVGVIAKEVIHLTQEALYQRNLQLQQANQEIDSINNRLAEKNQALCALAERDQLTGLYNRRKLNDVLQKEQNRLKRYKTPFCIIMLDIDHFKHINDNYGHHAGDQVLKRLSNTLTTHLRNTDILGRWGGEEFLLICPQMTLTNAKQLAEKLRKLTAELVFTSEQQVTVSLGVTEFRSNDSISSVLTRVDSCLYQAKNGGRNQYVAG
ncbi:sensor domain-containing diguanylate cyclase [Photobacterium kagoshimensis]|uniref:sensor domain-containing diguanylate cyclase n=1 Tax=Photobacterium kagoshimensis TaxID=2910242 RepID=UPI003D0AA313